MRNSKWKVWNITTTSFLSSWLIARDISYLSGSILRLTQELFYVLNEWRVKKKNLSHSTSINSDLAPTKLEFNSLSNLLALANKKRYYSKTKIDGINSSNWQTMDRNDAVNNFSSLVAVIVLAIQLLPELVTPLANCFADT